MDRRGFIKKSAIGACALVIGQGLVLSSCKKDEPNRNDEPPTNGDVPYISDNCVSCGACLQACPVDAIIDKDTPFRIDPA